MAAVSLDHGLVLAAILFAIGFAGLLDAPQPHRRAGLHRDHAERRRPRLRRGRRALGPGRRPGHVPLRPGHGRRRGGRRPRLAIRFRQSLRTPRRRRRRRDEGLTDARSSSGSSPPCPPPASSLLVLLNRRLGRAGAALDRRRLRRPLGAGRAARLRQLHRLAAGRRRVPPGPLDLVRRRRLRAHDRASTSTPVSVVLVLVITCRRLPHPPVLDRVHGATTRASRRFFMYMNLFVASMLVLVLADNLLLLYLGWEGVGLCSYLLIVVLVQGPGRTCTRRARRSSSRASATRR